ncbi:hypothetical protein L1887_09130 [Cichorium endivia]|nr:hypothetical protein L1887_09130 [Cichorium endivia]
MSDIIYICTEIVYAFAMMPMLLPEELDMSCNSHTHHKPCHTSQEEEVAVVVVAGAAQLVAIGGVMTVAVGEDAATTRIRSNVNCDSY